MNACMELVGFSTSNNVKNHCSKSFKVEVTSYMHGMRIDNMPLLVLDTQIKLMIIHGI